MDSSSTLLTLPAEIRLTIWDYATAPIRVHYLHDGVSVCGRQLTEICEGPLQCHEHISSRDLRCRRCCPPERAQWFQCCRQVYLETHLLRAKKTIFSFASSHVLLQCVRRSPTRLFNLSQIHLHLGPAKFGEPADRIAAKQALTELLCVAKHLRRLELSLGYYYQAYTDRIMLDTEILEILVQFRKLECLRLEMGRPPPGPTGGSFGPRMKESLKQRLGFLESVLRKHLCHSCILKQERKDTLTTTLAVKSEVLALTEPHGLHLTS